MNKESTGMMLLFFLINNLNMVPFLVQQVSSDRLQVMMCHSYNPSLLVTKELNSTQNGKKIFTAKKRRTQRTSRQKEFLSNSSFPRDLCAWRFQGFVPACPG
ncbi:MAG: hypothetical protein HGA43_17730 [Nitrospirae bacterium]|nr:hypothetical protein [Nitrospirota bacterium]